MIASNERLKPMYLSPEASAFVAFGLCGVVPLGLIGLIVVRSIRYSGLAARRGHGG